MVMKMELKLDGDFFMGEGKIGMYIFYGGKEFFN